MWGKRDLCDTEEKHISHPVQHKPCAQQDACPLCVMHAQPQQPSAEQGKGVACVCVQG